MADDTSFDAEKDSSRATGEHQPHTGPDFDSEAQKASVGGPKSESSEADAERQKYLVKFEDGDPENPHNYSTAKKGFITLQMGLLCLTATMASSICSEAEPTISEVFGISEELSVLEISLFILGYCFGPVIWAPIAEVYGRRWSMLPATFVLGLFSIGSATSNHPAAFFITRFFGGVFGAGPIAIAPAALGDFFGPQARGLVMVLMSIAITGGPTLAPIIGAALTVNPHLGWRWTAYMEAIISFAICALATFCLPETSAPVLLKRKAQKLRKTTGNDKWWHPHESERISPSNVLDKHLSRALRMFFTEPMLLSITLYSSFVYSLIFLALEVFPIVFYEQRGYSLVVSAAPFIAILIGVICALPINIANQPRYARLMKKNNGRPVPEGRLPPMVVGGLCLVIGLFWFGWTANPKYSWVLPCFGAIFIGAGFNIVFLQSLNHIVDTYGPAAASAISANTIVRSLVAAGLPMAAFPMFDNLGVPGACSLLAGLACLALPIPLLFMKYGPALRARSKFAPS